MELELEKDARSIRRGSSAFRKLALSAGLCLAASGAMSANQDPSSTQDTGGTAGTPAPPTLQETRLVMGKWIETQQIISKERNEWSQGKEILTNRLDLVRQEITGLAGKIKEAEANVAATQAKRDELLAQEDALKATGTQLSDAVTAMENEVRRLFKSLPAPVQEKLQPLRQRIPDDPANTRASVAERFQNVLGILNELNKANNELTVSYEVRDLTSGKPSEVRALYVGLAQAFYVSARGESGIGRPTAEGWTWEPSQAVSNDVLTALDIVQGKQTPAFVPLPVKLQ
jgi:hypothetical protein